MDDTVYLELGGFRGTQAYSVSDDGVSTPINYVNPSRKRLQLRSAADKLLPKSAMQCNLGNLRTQETYPDYNDTVVLEGAAAPKGTGHIKLLPTKAVAVQGKNPHIRLKQHYALDEAPKVDKPTASTATNVPVDDKALTQQYDKIMQQLAPNKRVQSLDVDSLSSEPYDNIHALLNNATAFDPQKLSTLMRSLVDHGHVVSKGGDNTQAHFDAVSNKVFGGLNLKHNINGTSLAGHLFDKLQAKSDFTYDLSSNEIHNAFSSVLAHKLPQDSNATMESSITDKKFALFNVRRNSAAVPMHEKNSYVSKQLNQFADAKFISHSLKIDLANKQFHDKGDNQSAIEKAHPLRDMPTMLDFSVKKYGVANTAKILTNVMSSFQGTHKDYVQGQLTGDGLEFPADNLGVHLIGASINPRAIEQVLHTSNNYPVTMFPGNSKKYVGALVEAWGYSSTNGLGGLIKKAMPHIMHKDMQPQYLRPDSDNMYQKSTLTEDKLPLNFSDAVTKLQGMTDSHVATGALNSKNNTLYRGVNFQNVPESKRIMLAKSLSSTSTKKDVASEFAQVYGEDAVIQSFTAATSFKNLPFDLPDTMAPYVKQVDEFSGRRYLMHFDKGALLKDKRIFAVLDTQGLDYMTKKQGIPSTENLRTYEDEGEFISNFF